MANLDTTIARLRALAPEEQEAFAAQIDQLLDDGNQDLLSKEQWAEIEARLNSGEAMTPHDDVVRAFRNTSG